MSTKYGNLYTLIGVLLGILCFIFGCISLRNKYQIKHPWEQFPIRILSIRVDENQRAELFSQLRKFSEKHDLEFYLSEYKPEKSFFVVMDGELLRISALSKIDPMAELNISFFEKDPTNPPTQETVDEVYNDLKSFISEVPSAVIVEEK